MITPLLYVWGDDDLIAERLVERFERGLEAELGSPLERWDLRAELTTAATGAAQLQERLGTGVLFGGGTLAVVANPGALVRRNDTRDRVVGAIGAMAAGNAVVFVEAARSGAKGPGPNVSPMRSSRPAAGSSRRWRRARPRSAAWIESEARERGMTLGQGAARELADRLGARVTDGDVDRRYLSRIASGELDKLTLRHAMDGAAITVDDVRGLVAESTPGSVWALTDAVGERRGPAALLALDRLVDDDARARPAGGAPSTGGRAARARRSAGRRDGPAGGGPGDGHQQRVPRPDAGDPGQALDDRRARGSAGRSRRGRRARQGRAGLGGRRRAAEAGVHDVGPDARDRGSGSGQGSGGRVDRSA